MRLLSPRRTNLKERKVWTKNRVGGVIATLWGGGAVGNRLVGATPVARNEAYAARQNLGFWFAVVLGLVGLYYLIKG